MPGANIFSALPKCSLLHASIEAPLRTEARLIVFLLNLTLLVSIDP